MKRITKGILAATVALAVHTGSAGRITSYSYTPEGLLETMDGPRTDVVDVTTYSYDAQGYRITMTNALGHVTRFTQHDGAGRVLASEDPNGIETLYTYHPRGWLLTVSVAGAVTRFDYDPVGNLVKVTTPDGGIVQYTYDPASRLTEIADSLGNRIVYTLDNAGNRTAEEVFDASGVLRHRLARLFNTLGQVDQLQDAAGQATMYTYDPNGNPISSTDALTRPSTQTFDPLDRLSTQTDAASGVTRYTYDASDRVTSVTDPNGAVTTYTYNGFGERTSQSSPDTGVTTYTYDSAGNLASKTDARGITVAYAYDALNRLTSVQYPDVTLNVFYEYDQGANGIGRLTTLRDAGGVVSYAYNNRGNLIEQTRDTGSLQTTLRYQYDLVGRLAGIVYPSGRLVEYVYDLAGQVVSVKLTDTNGTRVLADNVEHLPFGPVQAIAYGNGLLLTRTFDQNYQLTGQQIPGVLEATYNHDPVGNIVTWGDQLDAMRDQGFVYDALDRLTYATGPIAELTYDYDPVGNRLSEFMAGTQENYTYTPNSNRLERIDGALTDVVETDAAGNITRNMRGAFTYSDANRLAGYSDAGVLATYVYNGNGERIVKTVDGITTHFRYGRQGELLAELDDTGVAIREYVYLDGQPLAVILEAVGGGAPSPINFNDYSVLSYDPAQDVSGGANILDAGATIQLTGNTWKRIDLGYDVTPDTVLAFEFNSGQQGEIHAIGFDNDTSLSPTQMFQVYGTQSWGVSLAPYGGTGWQAYTVRLGEHLSGHYSHLVLAMDDDAAASGEGQFRNVRIYESAPPALAVNRSLTFASDNVVSLDSAQDVTGTAEVSPDGTTLNLTGNTWKRVDMPYTVTPDTVLEFEFASDQKGEIHAIGFDDDTALSPERMFRVYGSQAWGNTVSPQYSGAGWQTYRVPVGQYATGFYPFLVFAMDDDAASAGNSQFRNVRLLEPAASAPATGAAITYAHTDHLGAVIKATDESGQLVWDADRDPFGSLLMRTSGVELPIRFPGQYYDAESGLFYNYFRYYDPATGRYITSDPLGLGGGLNTYAYVEGNPLSRKDPLGLFFEPNMNFSYPEDLLSDLFGYHFGPEDEFLERVATEVGQGIACTARCVIIGEIQGAAAEKALEQAAKRVAHQGAQRILKEGLHYFKLGNQVIAPASAFKCALDCTEGTACSTQR